MSHPAVDPTLAAVSDPVDHLGITAEQLALCHTYLGVAVSPGRSATLNQGDVVGWLLAGDQASVERHGHKGPARLRS